MSVIPITSANMVPLTNKGTGKYGTSKWIISDQQMVWLCLRKCDLPFRIDCILNHQVLVCMEYILNIKYRHDYGVICVNSALLKVEVKLLRFTGLLSWSRSGSHSFIWVLSLKIALVLCLKLFPISLVCNQSEIFYSNLNMQTLCLDYTDIINSLFCA